MSKYKVNEPSALKFLKANGAVVDENGNVVNEASDYWKKVYEQAEPKVAKYLHADGTIDENPGSGGGADLEDNKTATIDVSTYTEPVEIEPTAGKDGMKKATVTLSNIPSGGNQYLYFGTFFDQGYHSFDAMVITDGLLTLTGTQTDARAYYFDDNFKKIKKIYPFYYASPNPDYFGDELEYTFNEDGYITVGSVTNSDRFTLHSDFTGQVKDLPED